MELVDFLRQIQGEVRAEAANRANGDDGKAPYTESVFTEIVMQHMSAIGMTFEAQPCHFAYRNGALRLSGYALSEDSEQLDLFVSLYGGRDEIVTIPDSETKGAAEQCIRFLEACVKKKLSTTIDESNEAYEFILTIQETYNSLDQIRIYVLTDRVAKAKNFKPREIANKTVKLEVMDIERLHRHLSEGKPRDEVLANFEEISGGPLPCVLVPDPSAEYDCALTAIPAETLRILYDSSGSVCSRRTFVRFSAPPTRLIREYAKRCVTIRKSSWRITTASCSSLTGHDSSRPPKVLRLSLG
jgi:hypothetical protein